MTKKGYENWHNRVIDLLEAQKDCKHKKTLTIWFQMKSGRTLIIDDAEDFFGTWGEYGNQDNITIYNKGCVIEVDIESIETITW